MIKKFKVLYKNIQIGLLTMTETSYVYVPNLDSINKIEENGDKILNILKDNISADTIPFFETRISNSKRFDNVGIGYHTDPYELIEESYS